jgi:outer membrane protein TolC
MWNIRTMARLGTILSLTFFRNSAWALRALAFENLQPGEKLSLKRAIELTLRNHPRRLQMESEAAAARERMGEAQSELLPQVYGAADYLRSTDNPIGNTTYLNPGFVPRITGTLHGGVPNAGQSFATINNFLTGVGAQQYLFDFGRVREQIRQRGQGRGVRCWGASYYRAEQLFSFGSGSSGP